MKLLFTVFFVLSSFAGAEMIFKTKLVEVTAQPDVDVLNVDFPFEVKGGPSEIVEYDAPCSCLTARIEPLKADRSTKLKWEEGESGKVIGRFKMGNFKGTIDKAIVLKMKGSEEPIQLVVRVTIPVLFDIQPSTLQWKIGEGATTKIFKIKVNNDQPINLVKHSGTSNNFPYQVKTIKEGWEYELTVTPQSTATPGMGMIRLETDSAIKRHQRHQVFVVVKKDRR
ncbi:hypothetical protein N9Z02_01010 [Akkermansiaceae bacterium]|nr:hypothetical protein [Akkermansiaceae bacterium]